MTATILKHEKFGATPPAAATAVAVAPAAPAASDDAPPVRRHVPLVEKYGDEIAGFFRAAIPVFFGLAMFVAIWAMLSAHSTLPGPLKTLHSAIAIFSDPFYRKGPNDQGIGWNILMSLGRVGIGFGMAALIGIPLGFMIGRFRFLARMTPAIRMIKEARTLGLKVMMGSMNESTIGSAAVANMLPLLDEADADGPLLLKEDVGTGLKYENGIIQLSGAHGLGVRFTGLKKQ